MIPESGTRRQLKRAVFALGVLPLAGETYESRSDLAGEDNVGYWHIVHLDWEKRTVNFEEQGYRSSNGEPIPCFIHFKDWFTYLEGGFLKKYKHDPREWNPK